MSISSLLEKLMMKVTQEEDDRINKKSERGQLKTELFFLSPEVLPLMYHKTYLK